MENTTMNTMETAVAPATTAQVAEIQYVDREVQVPDPNATKRGRIQGGIIGGIAGAAIGTGLTAVIVKIKQKAAEKRAEKDAKNDELKKTEEQIKMVEALRAAGYTITEPAPQPEAPTAGEKGKK